MHHPALPLPCPPRLSRRERMSRAIASAKAGGSRPRGSVLCSLSSVLGFLLLAALPLRAQLDLTPDQQVALPIGHSYILDALPVGQKVLLFTTDEVYLFRSNLGDWQKILSLRLQGVRPVTASTVTTSSDPNYWVVNTWNHSDDANTFYRVRENPPAQVGSAIPFDDLAKDIAATPGGQLYFIDNTSQLWRGESDGLGSLTRLTDPVSNIGKLSLGADGSVYALDTSNQVFRFSSTGSLLNQYTLAQSTNAVNFAVSDRGVLYALDMGSTYSGIYDAASGNYLGRFAFDTSDISDPKSFGGRPSISVSNEQALGAGPEGAEWLIAQTGSGLYLHIYDVTPAPTTLTLTSDSATPYTTTATDRLIFFVTSGRVTQSGLIDGNGPITKAGDGTLVLSSAATYGGNTSVIDGTLELAGNQVLPTSTTVFLTGAATLDLNHTTQSVTGLGTATNPLAGNIATGTLTSANPIYLASGTYSATFTGSSATSRLLIGGDTGATVTLSGTNDAVYTSDHNAVLIGFTMPGAPGAAGTVKITNPNALAAATENVQISTGTLDLNGQSGVRANLIQLTNGRDSFLINNSVAAPASFAGEVSLGGGIPRIGGAGDLELSGVLSSSNGNYTYGLEKIGAGTLTLTGASTYTGPTTVSAGTLSVDGSLANTAVTVDHGATLGGSGSIGGSVTITDGAHLAPGNSPGTLTFTNGLALNDGAILDFQLGTTSDLIRVSGGTLAGSASPGGLTLNLSDAGGFGAATYVLFDFTGATLSGFDLADFALGTTIAGYDYSFNLTSSSLELIATASAIPEPSTYAAIFGALGLALAVIRRRSRASL